MATDDTTGLIEPKNLEEKKQFITEMFRGPYSSHYVWLFNPKALASVRLNYQITLEEVATALGVQSQTIRKYENGTRKPSVEMLAEIATLYSKSPMEFFQIYKKEVALQDD